MKVRLWDEREIVFNVSSATYVSQVKEAIQHKEGISRVKQRIVAYGKLLRDHEQLGDIDGGNDIDVISCLLEQVGC